MHFARLAGVTAVAIAALLIAAAGASAAPYDSDSVIVKYKPGVTTSERVALFDRAGVVRTIGNVDGVGAKVVRTNRDPAAAAASLSRSSKVEYAEPNFTLHVLATPNDARFGEMYALNNTGQSGGRSDA